jgi:CheY-like chemotaxis protein
VLDPRTIVAETEDLLRRLIGAHIEIRIASGSPVGRVRVDAGHLAQVLVNLAVNARDAMPDGGTLRIETDDVEVAAGDPDVPPGSYVRIRVDDDGTGMDEATRRRAFEPFFTTKDVGEGTGLGLATVFGIVAQSGGYVTVEAALGVGTTVSVYLPRTLEPADVPAPAQPELAGPRGSGRVLVVEDEDAIRDLVAETLTAAGYAVRSAAGAAEALALAQAERFDLVLTDVVMPKLSGEQLAQALAAGPAPPKIVFMSGYAHDRLSSQSLAAPFLAKPFTLARLREVVRTTLDA